MTVSMPKVIIVLMCMMCHAPDSQWVIPVKNNLKCRDVRNKDNI